MSIENTIILVGNVATEPKLRFTANGRAVCNFRLGVNERRGDFERSTFITVAAWRGLAENVAASLNVGDRIQVQGAYTSHTADLADGTTGYFSDLVADEIGVALRFATVSGVDRVKRQPASVPAGEPQERPANVDDNGEIVHGDPVAA